MPKYVRVYGKELDELDSALNRQTALSPFDGELTWYFLCIRLGQRHLLEPGQELGPESFDLAEEFDMSRTTNFSVHLAMNLFHVNPSYSLLWNGENMTKMFRGEQLSLTSHCHVHFIECMHENNCFGSFAATKKHTFPLFGLSELRNANIYGPKNDAVEAMVSGRLTYLQMYTSTVKVMGN